MEAWQIGWVETPTTTLELSTTLPSRLLEGEKGQDVVGLLVQIGTGSFSGDPSLWEIEGGRFYIPNRSAYPEGLPLLSGLNRIAVQPVLLTGEVGVPITARISRIETLPSAPSAPTGIRCRRLSDSVQIEVECPIDPAIRYVRFYVSRASKQEGGEFVLLATGIKPTEQAGDEQTAGQLNRPIGVRSGRAEIRIRYPSGEENSLGEISLGENDYPVRIDVGAIRRPSRYVATHTHTRTTSLAGLEGSIPPDEPLWYGASLVYETLAGEVEGPLSETVSGAPLSTIPSGPVTIPAPNREEISSKLASEILARRPRLDVKPGSFWDDAFLAPLSSEDTRVRFVLDFAHRARAARTLLQIDDPDMRGESVPIPQSPYKRALRDALYLGSDSQTQKVIDMAFEALASNVGLSRSQGLRASGGVEIQVRTKPQTSILVGAGTRILFGSRPYRVTIPGQIDPVGSSFDPTTGVYRVEVRVEAEQVGASQNVSQGETGQLEGYPVSVSAVASQDLLGTPADSNLTLTERIERALASVDSGTIQGYGRVLAGTSGVAMSLLLTPPNKDYRRGPGGLDAWVWGVGSPVVRSETFVFDTENLIGAETVLTSDVDRLQFRVKGLGDSRPILYLLDDVERQLGVRNETKGYWFDLTGVRILAPDGFALSPEGNDAGRLDQSDLIRASVRVLASQTYQLDRQPVEELIRLEGEETGLIPPSRYGLDRSAFPLEEGRSVRAKNLLVLSPLPGAAAQIPSLTMENEPHVMLEQPEPLGRLGIDPSSVRVRDPSTGQLFLGPLDPIPPGRDRDWEFVFPETNRLPLQILATQGAIRPGDRVWVDYKYDQNFVVEYHYDGLVESVQVGLEETRHADSDPLAKSILPVRVRLGFTVVLRRSPTRPISIGRVEAQILTNLSRLFETKQPGEGVWQSEIVQSVTAVPEVAYLIQPLAQMGIEEGTLLLGENVYGFAEIPAWSGPKGRAYLSGMLRAPSLPRGGGRFDPIRVEMDRTALQLFPIPPSQGGEPYISSIPSAYIIGEEGLAIPEPIGEGVYPGALVTNRVVVFVSTPPTEIAVTYRTGTTLKKSQDVLIGPFEKAILGTVEIQYDQETP